MAERTTLRNQLLYHLRISRPRFWFYVFGPYLLGIIAGYTQPNSTIFMQSIGLGLFFLLPANYFLYGINDIFDYETDVLNSKKQGYEVLTTPDRRNEVWLTMILLTLPWWWMLRAIPDLSFAAVVGFFVMGGAYSAPPIRTKVKPFLDALTNIFYVLPGVAGFTLWQHQLPHWRYLLAGGLWCMAMHAFSAVPDITADKKSGMRTIATALGQRWTLLFCATAYALSGMLIAPDIGWFSIVLAAPYLFLCIKAMQERSLRGVFMLYKKFPTLNILIGMILTLLLLSNMIRQ